MPVRSRRLFLTALFAVSLLSGCALKKTAESSAESASQKKAAPLQRKPSAKSGKTAEPPKPQKPSAAAKERAFVPVFLPAIADAPQLSLDQQIVISFSPKAAQHGAPAAVPPLRATVLSAPGSVNAVFSALSMTVWRITWDGSTITEARSPRLDERISAERLLRDLTFTLWPTQSIAAAVPSGFVFSSHRQGPTEIRELSSEGTALLRAHITQMGSRSMITIENEPEGYTLQIESLL